MMFKLITGGESLDIGFYEVGYNFALICHRKEDLVYLADWEDRLHHACEKGAKIVDEYGGEYTNTELIDLIINSDRMIRHYRMNELKETQGDYQVMAIGITYDILERK